MLSVRNTVLLLCDVQERFRPVVHEFASVVATSLLLGRTAALLGVPTVVTEQYPKALGPTVAELGPLLRSPGHPSGAVVFPKLRFSMLEPAVTAHLDAECPDCTDAILVGIEAHVCIQQTALDVLAAGKRPWVVVDGVSSQRPADRAVALALLRQQGALLTTAEAVALMLLGGAEHPQFKQVSALLKAHNQLGGSALGP